MLFESEIRGAQVHVKVATSVKKDGTFRFRETYGIGGSPAGVRGSEIHIKKLDELADVFSNETGFVWKAQGLVYIDRPRQYYGQITDGIDTLVYQYITSDAPGSGQQYLFCPRMSSKRVPVASFHPQLAAWIIKSRYPKDLMKINWQDHEIMLDLIRQGVTADIMESAIAVMR